MRKILILADDLSGAADSAIACARSGLSAAVTWGSGGGDFDVDVLSVDGDTRCLTPHAAAEGCARLMRKFAHEDQLIFKKLDSTLRGNVAAELAAVLRVRRELASEGKKVVAIMAPAFPAQGRTTSMGVQLLNGIPLQETTIWRREERAGRAHIPEMLQAAGLQARSVGVGADLDRLRRAIVEPVTNPDVLVCDAESDDDLAAIAAAGAALDCDVIWVGSAGLAYHLPQAAGIAPGDVRIADEPLAVGPTLFVVGSLSQTSREQAKTLAESDGVITITLSPDDLLAGSRNPKFHEHGLALQSALHGGRDVSLVLDSSNSGLKLDSSRALTRALARMAAPYAKVVGALVATGGETARAVLDAWGVSALRMVGEIESGLPFSVTENWSQRLPVLTKAGDFGNPQTLRRCQDFLRCRDRSSLLSLYHKKQ